MNRASQEHARSSAVETLCLDLDETLWDPREALQRAEQAAWRFLGRECAAITQRYSPSDLYQLRTEIRASLPDIAHDLTALRLASVQALAERCGLDPATAERMAQGAVAAFLEHRSRVRLFPETHSVLALLAERYRLVAVTNGNACVDRAGIGHYFVAAVTPADAGSCKPDPAIFVHALEIAGGVAETAAHVGDAALEDVSGARDAGLRTIWFNPGAKSWPGPGPRADAEIASLAELPACLEGLQ